MSAQSRAEFKAIILTIIVGLVISFAVGFLIIAAHSAKGQTVELRVTPAPVPGFVDHKYLDPSRMSSAAIATNLIVPCGEKGSVVISRETGKVQFQGDCNPDEGARTFWLAIERMYQPCRNK